MRPSATKTPHHSYSFTKDIDTIFWIFDAFCVFELNASDDRAKQFMVLQRAKKSGDEFAELAAAQLSSLKMLRIKEMIFEMRETFWLMLFKEACDFHVKHQGQAISIIKNKYY